MGDFWPDEGPHPDPADPLSEDPGPTPPFEVASLVPALFAADEDGPDPDVWYDRKREERFDARD